VLAVMPMSTFPAIFLGGLAEHEKPDDETGNANADRQQNGDKNQPIRRGTVGWQFKGIH